MYPLMQAAAALHGTKSRDTQLTEQYEKRRSDYERVDEHGPNHVCHGTLLQANTTNQFCGTIASLIAKHSHPTACCGAMSMAHAIMISNLLDVASSEISRPQLDSLIQQLRDTHVLLPEVAQRSLLDSER